MAEARLATAIENKRSVLLPRADFALLAAALAAVWGERGEGRRR